MARPFSFRKESRLTKESEFASVMKKGTTLRRAAVRLLTLKKADLSAPRLGIWVSKRQFRNATDRNRMKRWVREFFRKNKAKIVPCDLIVQVNRSPESDNHGLFEAALKKCFVEAKLLS